MTDQTVVSLVLGRTAFLDALERDCPVHRDATAGAPCFAIPSGGRRPSYRMALCGARVRQSSKEAS